MDRPPLVKLTEPVGTIACSAVHHGNQRYLFRICWDLSESLKARSWLPAG